MANSAKMYDSMSTLRSSPRALEGALELRDLKAQLHQLQDKSYLPTPADRQPAVSHVSILLQVGQAEGGHTLATGRLRPGLQT